MAKPSPRAQGNDLMAAVFTRMVGRRITMDAREARIEMKMMQQTGEWMGGWADGGMWLWTVITVLVVALLAAVIRQRSNSWPLWGRGLAGAIPDLLFYRLPGEECLGYGFRVFV